MIRILLTGLVGLLTANSLLATDQPEPFKPAPLERTGAPPVRKQTEVDAILKAPRPVLVLVDKVEQAQELVIALKISEFAPEVALAQDPLPWDKMRRYQAVYLHGVASPGESLWSSLTEYLGKGGGLGVIPGGDEMNLDAYNRGPAQKLLPGTWHKLATQSKKPAAWNLTQDSVFQRPLLRPFKEWTTPDAKIDFILQPRTASRYWEVEPKDKQMVLVHYADERDRPALLERSAPRGSGKVLMFTTTLSAGNPAWNNYLEATTSFYPVLVSLCTKYLAGDDHTSGPPRKLHVVLAAGPKDHGPGDHDYPLWQKRWQHILGKAKDLEVGTAFGWPSAEQWQKADVIVFNSHHEGWKADKARDLDALLARGGGLVYLHWAISGLDATDVLARRIGLSVGKIKYRHGPLEIDFDSVHPITRGFGKLRLLDESYWNLTGDPEQINVLGSAVEEGKARPLFWTREQDRGRIFVSIPGHYTWTFDDPLYRILVLRGMAWTARQPIDRLCGLATYGARMAE